MGRTWAYAYNTAGQLTSATDPMGNVTTYTYGAGSTGNPQLASDLLTITDPNAQPGGPDAGDATVNVYDAAGQVTSQTDPMGFKTTFNYCVNAAAGNCMNPATGTGFVTVTDPDGNSTVYDYQQGTLAAQSAWTGSTLTSETGPAARHATAPARHPARHLHHRRRRQHNQRHLRHRRQHHLARPTRSATAPPTTSTGLRPGQLRRAPADCAPATAARLPGRTRRPVAPGGMITPPSSAPPLGITYTLYDTDGNELYSTTGVYEPGRPAPPTRGPPTSCSRATPSP